MTHTFNSQSSIKRVLSWLIKTILISTKSISLNIWGYITSWKDDDGALG